jgi:uncharacterized protein (TIGR02646 family)
MKKEEWEKLARIGLDSFYRSDLWRNLRYDAFKKYGQRCHCCGVAGHVKQLHVDHIKPKSKYPELALDIRNLQILCEDCNKGKGGSRRNRLATK